MQTNRRLKKTIGLTALLAVLCAAGAARAATYTFGDVKVTHEELPCPEQTSAGYREFRFRVTNLSERPRQVRIRLPLDGGGSQLRRLEATRQVGAKATVKMSIFQPPLSLGGGGAAVMVDGKGYDMPMALRSYMTGPDQSGVQGRLLMSQGAAKALVSMMGTWRSRYAGHYGANPIVESTVPVDQWSTHWLGYTTFTTVVATAQEISDATPEVRSGLSDYLAAGGRVLVIGQWSPPKDWNASQARGNLIGLSTWRVGLGTCEAFAGKPAGLDRPIQAHLRDSRTPIQAMRPHSRRHAWSTMKVVDTVGLDVQGVFVLMLLFAVVIGPVNLLVLSKMNRRILMLVTVPVLSLLTCGGIFVYALVSEGWSPNLRMGTLTLLDEQAQRAVTVGALGYYCPMTPSGGLHFDANTELTPHLGQSDQYDRHYYGGGYRGRSTSDESVSGAIDWTGDQHLTDGWIQARVPLHFSVRKVEKSRARLTLVKQGDTVKATNGLGYDLTGLLVADARGTIYRAGRVAAGAEVTLRRSEGSEIASVARNSFDAARLAETVVSVGALDVARQVAERPAEHLRPNCYVALTDVPTMETGLDNPKVNRTVGVIFGLMKEPLE